MVREKRNFDFVDTIRGIAMVGIVFEHAADLGWVRYPDLYSTFIQASVLQVFKFTTIAFFLISGFLINYKFTEYTPVQYMRNRLKSTIAPWMLWLNVLVLMNFAELWFNHRRNAEAYPLPDNILGYLMTQYHQIITGTSFWFVLNFLICIALLLLFKKHLYKIGFGIFLGLTSLVYSINLYFDWFVTQHTTAVFGFVFFLWLGVYLNKKYSQVMDFVNRTSFAWIGMVTFLLFLLADAETVYLKMNGVEDAYNTLRISNVLYSLSFFALLLKWGAIPIVNSVLEPRKTTYGIYLIHHIVITFAVREILRPFQVDMQELNVYMASLYSFARFLLAYLITFLLVKVIVRTRFKWSIGS